MINGLTGQAVHFQHLADSIYDRFQMLCYNYDYDENSPDKKRKRVEEEKEEENNNEKNNMSLRRFCRVSILTAGNDLISGFANMDHSDDDQFDQLFHEIAWKVLQNLQEEACERKKGQLFKQMAIKHIMQIFWKAWVFHVYTTCGYKLFLKNKNKKVYAYFIYNSLNEVVEIPTDRSCYHTFAGKIGRHQTSVPVIYDGTNVSFNDEDLFIFAWGASSPEKISKRRSKCKNKNKK